AAAGRPGGFPTEVNVTDFEVAIFDNRWPGLVDSAPPGETRAYGRCEVVVYSPRATGTLGDLPADRVALILQAVADRVDRIMADPNIAAVVPFENRGAFIGATLPHPHGQIYALGDLPPVFARQAEGFAALDGPLWRMLAERRDLVIAEDAHTLTVCPAFARYPYESWVVPKAHVAGAGALDDDALMALAAALAAQVRRYDSLFGTETPYVMWQAVPPRGAEGWPFHIQFWPLQRGPGKMKYLASVEQITGLYLLDVPPEEAAATLRATQPDEVVR
ncbi:MAG: galactose-1-phosphate uridylyltransferase, partial [Alphaproteobacteria bacterium]